MWKKKSFSLGLVICLLLALPFSAFAKESNLPTIQPYYVYTSTIDTNLSIFSTGVADVKAKIIGNLSTTSVRVNAYLQRYSGGSWITVDSWSQSSNSSRMTLQENAAVTKGYQYRVQASYYAYAGSQYEYLVEYSSVLMVYAILFSNFRRLEMY